jgi:hypothetical protein
VAGIAISNIKPIYAKIVGVCVAVVTAAVNPKVTKRPSVIKVADFALFEVGKPSLNKPDATKIMPINIVSNETACIPSRNVLAIPEREIPTPTIPIEVSPIPGVNKSQSVISI